MTAPASDAFDLYAITVIAIARFEAALGERPDRVRDGFYAENFLCIFSAEREAPGGRESVFSASGAGSEMC